MTDLERIVWGTTFAMSFAWRLKDQPLEVIGLATKPGNARDVWEKEIAEAAALDAEIAVERLKKVGV